MAKEVLHHLEIAQDLQSLSSDEEWLRCELKRHCLHLASLERTIARLRLKIGWLKEGDANTSFFHLHASFRKRKNFIAKLQSGDQIVTSQANTHKVVLDFYTDLLGTAEHRPFTLNLQNLYQDALDLSSLDAPFTKDGFHRIKPSVPMITRVVSIVVVGSLIKDDIMATLHTLQQGRGRKNGSLELGLLDPLVEES